MCIFNLKKTLDRREKKVYYEIVENQNACAEYYKAFENNKISALHIKKLALQKGVSYEKKNWLCII
ncbi:MAG TPA: hypothetical protein DEB74_11965 [Lachnospiraceae bacterium]|nr:hypothetical protein [Lachnospiraceae bacterium]